MRDYKILDADGHILEPPDLWERYIDPAFRDRAPRMVYDDGMDLFTIDGQQFGRAFGGQNRVGAFGERDGREYPADMRYVDGVRGGFDPHERIADLDSENIDAVFLYPSLGLLCGAIDEPAFGAAVSRAYNRYIADFCAPYPDRLFGVAALPMQSIDDAIDELRYATDVLGLRQAFIRPNPYQGRLLSAREYDPLWALAQEREVAIGVHEGTGGMPAVGLDRVPPGAAATHIASHTVEMMFASLNIIWGGVCDRFPDLHFGFLECGGGWMSGWLDRMDRHFDDATFRARGGPETRPSEAFDRQCWISFEPVEESLGYLVEHLGPTNLLWATDYPHRDSFINAPKQIADRLPERHRQSVLAQGAIEFYRLGSH